MVTGAGLIEAKEYVDSLSKEETKQMKFFSLQRKSRIFELEMDKVVIYDY